MYDAKNDREKAELPFWAISVQPHCDDAHMWQTLERKNCWTVSVQPHFGFTFSSQTLAEQVAFWKISVQSNRGMNAYARRFDINCAVPDDFCLA